MTKPCLLLVCVLMFTALGAAQSSRKSISGSEVTGTFSHAFTGKYRGSSSEIKIQALGHGKLRIALDLIYPYTMSNGDLMANIGELDGEAAIDGDTATYTSEDGQCTITFKFVRPGSMKVSQEGSDASCGFGNRVTADGTYKKVSAKKPNFDRDH
jgi:hypothetical protein